MAWKMIELLAKKNIIQRSQEFLLVVTFVHSCSIYELTSIYACDCQFFRGNRIRPTLFAVVSRIKISREQARLIPQKEGIGFEKENVTFMLVARHY